MDRPDELQMWEDEEGKCYIYIPPKKANAEEHPMYNINVQIATGVTKVIRAVAQPVGLTIKVNDTSVEAEDGWIIHDENGTHILKVVPPKQSIDSATPGAASALKP